MLTGAEIMLTGAGQVNNKFGRLGREVKMSTEQSQMRTYVEALKEDLRKWEERTHDSRPGDEKWDRIRRAVDRDSRALGEVGKSAWHKIPQTLKREAVEILANGLTTPGVDFRGWFSKSLGNIGSAAFRAIPKLVALLKNKDVLLPIDRAWAAEALGRIGRKATSALPALIEVLEEPDEEDYIPDSNRDDWIEAGFYPEEYEESIQYDGNDALIRENAAEALGRIVRWRDKEGDYVIDLLWKTCFYDEDASVWVQAGYAYWRITGRLEGLSPLGNIFGGKMCDC
jgi:hypothetical protein